MRLNNIEQLKKLEAERTQGEWVQSYKDVRIYYVYPTEYYHNVAFGSTEANAAYIALLANMMPKLLKLVNAVETMLNGTGYGGTTDVRKALEALK